MNAGESAALDKIRLKKHNGTLSRQDEECAMSLDQSTLQNPGSLAGLTTQCPSSVIEQNPVAEENTEAERLLSPVADDPFSAGLGLQEASYVYGYSKKRLRKLIDNGKVPAVQVSVKGKLKWRVFPAGVPVACTTIDFSPQSDEPAPVDVAEQGPKSSKKKNNKRRKSAEVEDSLDFSVPENSSVPEERFEPDWSPVKCVDMALPCQQDCLVPEALPVEAVEPPLTAEQFSLPAEGYYTEDIPPQLPLLPQAGLVPDVFVTPLFEPLAELAGSAPVHRAVTFELDRYVSAPDQQLVVTVFDVPIRKAIVDPDLVELKERLGSLEELVSRLAFQNSYLETRIAALGDQVNYLTGTAHSKVGLRTILFAIPLVVLLFSLVANATP